MIHDKSQGYRPAAVSLLDFFQKFSWNLNVLHVFIDYINETGFRM